MDLIDFIALFLAFLLVILGAVFVGFPVGFYCGSRKVESRLETVHPPIALPVTVKCSSTGAENPKAILVRSEDSILTEEFLEVGNA